MAAFDINDQTSLQQRSDTGDSFNRLGFGNFGGVNISAGESSDFLLGFPGLSKSKLSPFVNIILLCFLLYLYFFVKFKAG